MNEPTKWCTICMVEVHADHKHEGWGDPDVVLSPEGNLVRCCGDPSCCGDPEPPAAQVDGERPKLSGSVTKAGILRGILCEVSDKYKVPIADQMRITRALWDAYAEHREEALAAAQPAQPLREGLLELADEMERAETYKGMYEPWIKRLRALLNPAQPNAQSSS